MLLLPTENRFVEIPRLSPMELAPFDMFHPSGERPGFSDVLSIRRSICHLKIHILIFNTD